MAAQSNYAGSIYQQGSSTNIQNTMNNEMMLPLIQKNQTNTLLKSVHGINMSLLVANNNSHMRNNSFARQNQTITNNSSLNVLKQDHNTTYELPSSLNIWLTHGL